MPAPSNLYDVPTSPADSGYDAPVVSGNEKSSGGETHRNVVPADRFLQGAALIELRNPEVDEVLGQSPAWLLQWGEVLPNSWTVFRADYDEK
jgi:hypothetical protein